MVKKKRSEHYEPNPKIKYPDCFEKLQQPSLGHACHLFERFIIARKLSLGPDPHRSAVWNTHAVDRRIELQEYLNSRVELQPRDLDFPAVG